MVLSNTKGNILSDIIEKIIQFGLWILFVAFVSVESTWYNQVGNGVAHFFSCVAEEKCEK